MLTRLMPVLIGLGLIVVVSAGAPDTAAPLPASYHIQALLNDDQFEVAGGDAVLQAEVYAFYAARQFSPAWLEGDDLNAEAQARLITLMASNTIDQLPVILQPGGLDPAYAEALTTPAPETAAALDIQLTRAFLQLENKTGATYASSAQVLTRES